MSSINLEDYNYNLPKRLIAQEAFHPRDKCKLMVIKENKIEHKIFSDIIDYLEDGDVLVLNETKVERCKLIGNKVTGGKVEVTLVQHLIDNYYETRIKGRNLKEGTKFIFNNNSGTIVQQEDDMFYVQFEAELNPTNLDLLTPSYIKRKVPEVDYQTVFAKTSGSLAAPTAGLHFTPQLLKRIKRKGVKIAKIQLDISFETFLPIRDVDNHSTGVEYFKLDDKNAQLINSGNIIAVGTTVVKCLESSTWHNGKILPTEGFSQIFINPGYHFKSNIKAIVTNFHLPKSSLLLLTCAYGDKERILKGYDTAIKQKYRLFSLGDAMVIFK